MGPLAVNGRRVRTPSAAGQRGRALAAGGALVSANFRYWMSIAPIVRVELRRWSQRARQIPDAFLRELALQKLRAEQFNAEVAATLATLAPWGLRTQTVAAIVALEVAYDYLDGLTELAVENPLRSGERLYEAFTDSLRSPQAARSDYYEHQPHGEDGGYLQGLSSTVAGAFAQLPAHHSARAAASRSTVRCASAQLRVHAAPQLGSAQLRSWARSRASGGQLGWREYIAGAVASVLSTHALIASATDPRLTAPQARQIDEAYLSISALSTMLDSLIDYQRDIATGDPWLIDLYRCPQALGGQLVEVAHHAVAQVRELPHSGHHLMTLVGVVAYYTSAPEATSELAGPPIAELHAQLGPTLWPTLAVMRNWRRAKLARDRLDRKRSAGETVG